MDLDFFARDLLGYAEQALAQDDDPAPYFVTKLEALIEVVAERTEEGVRQEIAAAAVAARKRLEVVTDRDPLSSAFLQETGDAVRGAPEPSRTDMFHRHPLRLVARELLRLEDADEKDIAWLLYDLVRGVEPPTVVEPIQAADAGMGGSPADVTALYGPMGGLALITAERRRQIVEEGYTAEHDDRFDRGELGDIAGTLALNHHAPAVRIPVWAKQLLGKTGANRVLQLVIAGALLAAELDRLQRRAAGASDAS